MKAHLSSPWPHNPGTIARRDFEGVYIHHVATWPDGRTFYGTYEACVAWCRALAELPAPQLPDATELALAGR